MNNKLKDAILQNGFLAKVTAHIVIVVCTVGLLSNLTVDKINTDIAYILTSVLSFALGYLFSKRDKKE